MTATRVIARPTTVASLPRATRLIAALALLCAAATTASAATETGVNAGPVLSDVLKVLTLQDYNTRVVVIGVGLLGLAGGLIGCFLLLRERALLGDALSHATLPGIGIAFILMVLAGGTGKSLAGLLLGATLSGVLGVGAILLIVHLTRIKEDAALGIVLSVMFGLGIAVLGIVQNMDAGHAAGLGSFIYGKTASMLFSDALVIGAAALICTLSCLALFKELKILCFDPAFARSQGWPVLLLDVVLMALVVGVTVIGLQAVGLILVIALLVIPPAAARFWTDRLGRMLAVSAVLGLLSCLAGAALSALLPRLPAGAVIVVVAGAFFGFSLVFGPARGVLVRLREQRRLATTVAQQNVLRALYEATESAGTARTPIGFAELLRRRSWSPAELRRAIARARRLGFIEPGGSAAVQLTPAGADAAWRVARNHRLWELYLITHADIAPSHVDRDADQVEHVLGATLLHELELQLADAYPGLARPPSPHTLAALPAAGGQQ